MHSCRMLVHKDKELRTARAGPAGCTQRIQLVQLFKMITNAACTVQGTGIAEKVGSRVWAACMLVCTHLWCQHAAVLAHEACSETVSCSADAGSVGAVRFCGTQVGCEHRVLWCNRCVELRARALAPHKAIAHNPQRGATNLLAIYKAAQARLKRAQLGGACAACGQFAAMRAWHHRHMPSPSAS